MTLRTVLGRLVMAVVYASAAAGWLWSLAGTPVIG
jgi:hypothetical protein